MRVRDRAALALLAFVVVGCGPGRPSVPVPKPAAVPATQVVWDMGALQHLAMVQEEFRRETLFCLIGHRHGSVLFVDELRPVVLVTSSPGVVRYERCRHAGTIGTVHNHTAACMADTGLEPDTTEFSSEDLEAFAAEEHELMAVTCGRAKLRIHWRVRGGRVEYRGELARVKGGS